VIEAFPQLWKDRVKHCRLIVDLNHLAYRNWAANSSLANSKGELTGAIYGTLKSLMAMSETFAPVSIIAVRDSPNPFRRCIYPAYKSHRLSPTPQEALERKNFDIQLDHLETVLPALGVPVLTVEEFEADDLAAVVTYGIPFEGWTVLVSGDRDYIQLVGERVALFSPMLGPKGKLLLADGPEYENLSEDEWKRTFAVGPRTYTRWVEKLPSGIPLERWMLYRLLVGDSSDNLPGVHGIGPQAALKVVERFYSLSALKSGSPDDWKAALNQRQILELEKSLASGDLDKQRRVIELRGLLRLEETKAFIEYLRTKLVARKLDEQLVRNQLIRWEMASFLIDWKKFLRAFQSPY
jgi:DNA polymerase-1